MLNKLFWLVAFFLATASVAAQPAGPGTADLTPLVGADGVHPGSDIHVAVRFRLPDGYHVNWNQPRDPSLIPVVIAVEPTTGITVSEIVWPEATDLRQANVPEPLRVFEREFIVGFTLKVAADVPVGDIPIPVRVRYQACDATMCYL